MRADMFKVIVERPRWGASHAASVKLKWGRDQDRKFIGHKRHVHTQGYYSKILNENLAPLVRFLRSRRGCLWDDVYSEICARLDTGSTVKMHVRMHLKDFVMIRIVRGRTGDWLHEGRVIGTDYLLCRRYPFFVDPRDGRLKDGAELMASLAAAARIEPGRAR